MADDFEALGRYTHFRAAARQALLRRVACLNNLATDMRRAAEDSDTTFDPARYAPRLQEVADVSAELRRAIECANEAGARCAQRAVSVSQLLLELGKA